MRLYISKRGINTFHGKVEDTSILSYNIEHRFNEPAQCKIILADPTGAKTQEFSDVSTTEDIEAAIGYDDSGSTYTDWTTEANSAAANDFRVPLLAPAINDIMYFGWDDKVDGFYITIGTGQVGVSTWSWFYWNGSAWAALSVTDGTSNFSLTGTKTVTWTPPSDWATTTVNSQGPFYYIYAKTGAGIAAGALCGQIWNYKVGVSSSVELEDPDNTDLFLGRIQRVEGDTHTRTCTLYCEDWLCQLDDEQITYDMREDLDGSGTRSSVIYPDVANTDTHGVNPAYNNAGTYYVYDSKIGLTADAHNGQYLILDDRMAGKIEQWTGPFQESVSIAADTTDTPALGATNVWDDDGSIHEVEDANSNLYIEYDFRTWIDISAFFTSIEEAYVDYTICSESTDAYVYIYDGTVAHYIGTIEKAQSADMYSRGSIRVPESILSTVWDANGETYVRVAAGSGAGTILKIDMLRLRTVCNTTGYSTATAISDGETYRLTVATDFSANAQRVWAQLPYSIAKEIYLHLESATGPILGYDDQFTLTAGAANIENTSGISTRQYVDRTPLEVIQDLAHQDKAQFYIALGGSTVTYKSTWNAAGTAMSDTTVLHYKATADLLNVFNKMTVYGMRVNDRQLSSSYSDSTSESTYGVTRSKVERSEGLVSEYDTLARATAIVNQQKDLKLMLSASIPGLDSTYRLGTEVKLTSTFLGLTNEMYIVDSWEYDSDQHLTTINMHPRVSQVGLIAPDFTVRGMNTYRRGQTEKYISSPSSDVV